MRPMIAIAVLLLAGCGQPHRPLHRDGVVSIDYCADQMVLGLLPPDRIRAVSFEADSDSAFAVSRATGIARLRPQLEDIVKLRPAVVVRSYGGDARLTRQLESLGIEVVQLRFPATLAEVRDDVLRVGSELGTDAQAQDLVAGFDAELAAARTRTAPVEANALYVTPGDVTTGPGSLVAEVIAAAGFAPYRQTPGWGSLPLEEMVRRPPDVIFRAFFDSARYRQDHWTSSRHPVVLTVSRQATDVEVPGAWLACGNWLAGHAVAALAKARERQP